MVVIAEPFRAHWEAEDELRKLGEREAHAHWLRWLLGPNPPTVSPPPSHDDVRNSDT